MTTAMPACVILIVAVPISLDYHSYAKMASKKNAFPSQSPSVWTTTPTLSLKTSKGFLAVAVPISLDYHSYSKIRKKEGDKKVAVPISLDYHSYKPYFSKKNKKIVAVPISLDYHSYTIGKEDGRIMGMSQSPSVWTTTPTTFGMVAQINLFVAVPISLDYHSYVQILLRMGR